ncbi:MAG: hypothetical protein QNL04_15100 [SAR324 cluster bacterium]|nr:hypothetical protein [SAR324 cluster bacterium]
MNDLVPSGENKTASAASTTTGTNIEIDITVQNGSDVDIDLDTELTKHDAIVLYFTMWCPICNGHADKMIAKVMPSYSNVGFYLVDYVSGSTSSSQISLVSSGYQNAGVTLLVDLAREIELKYDGTMGTTIVIDADGNILMNEDFKDGVLLSSILSGL